jgi:hypothetical protein
VHILTPEAAKDIRAAYRRFRAEGLPVGHAAWLVSRYEPFQPTSHPAWFLEKRRGEVIDLCREAERQLTEEVRRGS